MKQLAQLHTAEERQRLDCCRQAASVLDHPQFPSMEMALSSDLPFNHCYFILISPFPTLRAQGSYLFLQMQVSSQSSQHF